MQISRKSVNTLSKLFNIRANEWPRLLFLYLMYFVFVTGSIWAEIILEAAFLQQVGVPALAGFLIVKAIASILAFAIYTAFADRVANDRLLIAFLIITALAIASGLGLLGVGLIFIAYPLLYLLIFVPLDELFVAHWYTYVNDFYDTRAAKRIIPVLSTAGRLGGIAGGLTLPLLKYFLPSTGIIGVWLASLLTMALLAWLMPRLLKKDKVAGEQTGFVASAQTQAEAGRQRAAYFDSLREGYRYVSQTPFLRWLALGTLVLIMLLAFLQYQTWEVLKIRFESEEQISSFFGNVTWVANLIILPFQLFLLSRIIGRIGVGNANLIFPTGLFFIAASLLIRPLNLTAALAHFGRTNFYGAIGYPIDSLLYNAVPLRVKGRARAFIGGLVVPAGTLIGGLLLFSPLVSIAWFVPAFIGASATIFLVTALIIRQQYSQALVKMLEQEDFSFLLAQSTSSLVAADPATLNRLQQKLKESTSYEFTIFMAQLISQIGGKDAIPVLGQAVRDATDARSRAGILDVLAVADTRNEAVRQLYTDFLADPDGLVRQSAIAGLAQMADPEDKRFLSLALGMLSDQDPDVRVRVLTVLARTANFYNLPPAVETLDQLLDNHNPHRRAQGVRILGQVSRQQISHNLTDQLRPIRKLVAYLTDPEDEVRLEAAVNIESLSSTAWPNQVTSLVLERMQPLLQDPIERVRQATLKVLGQFGNHETHQAIIKALSDPSSQVQATAVEVLVQIGKSVIPALHAQLDSADPQLRKMAAIVLSRLSPRQFGGLIQSFITGNLLAIYRNHGYIEALSPYANFSSISTLQNVLQEHNNQLRDEIFYILGALHDSSAIAIITDTLQSDNERVRANAIEALEALTSPQTAQLIVPLFEPEPAPARLRQLGQETWDMQYPDTPRAIREIATDPNIPWLRVIMTFALGEMGRALPANGKGADSAGFQQEQKETPSSVNDPLEAPAEINQANKRQKRRPKPADLLGILSSIDQDTSTSADEQPMTPSQPSSLPVPLTLPEIEALLETSAADPVADVRSAARTARQMLAGFNLIEEAKKEAILLSTIEKIIFLKQVPFFKGMTINQLEVLANICEEELFEEDEWIFHQGDPGGALYVIVSGKVGIEQEKRKGSYARLATLGAYHYFGEMTLLDNGPRSAAALALQDTLTLRLRREPLIALARQYPDVSLELIQVLSERLRQANNRIAELTRSRPRELQKLFDKFD